MEEDKKYVIEVPPIVADDEILSRAVYDPSFFENGQLATTAFSLISSDGHGPEKYISVLRKNYCDVKTVAETFRPRIDGDELVGEAQMRTIDVRNITSPMVDHSINVSVEARRNRIPAHAGIFTMIDSTRVKSDNQHAFPLWMYVQSRLRDISNYCSF